MSREELLPYEGTATYKSQHHYQRKVGLIMYAAVSTRPDVAFAVSRLARFLSNLGPKHYKAADKVLCYLERHRAYALRLGGGEDFSVSTDALFVDNTLDRKSSQAYVITLFGGTIGWQANKIAGERRSTTAYKASTRRYSQSLGSIRGAEGRYPSALYAHERYDCQRPHQGTQQAGTLNISQSNRSREYRQPSRSPAKRYREPGHRRTAFSQRHARQYMKPFPALQTVLSAAEGVTNDVNPTCRIR
ncbi:hypothetical protein TMatcc_006702 [Talaromyces marneffei ATCC 18224]